MTYLEEFVKELRKLGLEDKILSSERIIVAFSGGADSTFLLHLFKELLRGTEIALEAAHLNHMIRGNEADRDEEFCRRFCQTNDIVFHSKKVDIPSLVKTSGSVEQVARRERYRFFDELSSDGKCLVATAHNADDNIETVVFNMLRGSGISGICGIPPVRDEKYIRPILSYSSERIRTLCAEFKINYVTDSTNLSFDYTRNKIRHKIIPLMREVVPHPEQTVLRLNESLRLDADFIDGYTESVFEDEKADCFSVEKFSNLHTAVKARVLRKLYNNCDHPEGTYLETVHINEIISLLQDKREAFSLNVPGKVCFICDNHNIRFSSENEANDSFDVTEIVLAYDEPVEINGFVVIVSENCSNGKVSDNITVNENIYNLFIHKTIKFDKIKGKLFVRTRRAGDTLKFGGMTRKLKKLFCDSNVPTKLRERLPIIADDDGIVLVPMFPCKDGYDAKSADKCVAVSIYKNKLDE